MLLVTYGAQYAGAEARIKTIASGIRLPKRLIIIRNDSPAMPPRQIGEWQYEVGGNNSAFEFSGWQAGLDCDSAREFCADVLLFANSSFVTHRFHSSPLIDTDIIRNYAHRRAIGGHLRRLGYEARWRGLDMSQWVITHFFIANPNVIEAMGPIVTESDPDRFLAPTYATDCLTNDEIWKGPMGRYLWTGLTRKYRGEGRHFGPETYDFFRRKILSIVNEIAFTARARQLGCTVDDLSPLAGVLDRALVVQTGSSELRPFSFLRRVLLDSAASVARTLHKHGDPEPDLMTAWCLKRAKRRLASKGD